MRLTTSVARGTTNKRVDGVVSKRKVDLLSCNGFVAMLQPVGWNVADSLDKQETGGL